MGVERFNPTSSSPEKPKPERAVTSRHTTRINDTVYDVYKLIDIAEKSDLPVQEVPMTEFHEYLAAEDGWTDVRGNSLGSKNIIDLANKYNQHWNTMIMAKPNWAEHIAKVRDADLQYPILTQGRTNVVDGVHRLTKAYLDDLDSISTRSFDKLPKEAIVKKD